MMVCANPQEPIPQRSIVFLCHPPIIPYGMFPPLLLPLPPPRMFLSHHRQQQRHNYPNALSEPISSMDTNKIIIKEVWGSNLDYEFGFIAELIEKYPFVSIDTEFPDVIFKPRNNNNHHRNLWPADKYQLLKLIVDVLNLIQIGFTLSDKDGNLPDLGTNGKNNYIWQFNFRDFNLACDVHVPASIALLHHQGINFRRNAVVGVSSARFAELAVTSRLLFNDAVTWVTFHSAYDFGYPVKILTRRLFPRRLEDFMHVLEKLFGSNVYELKHLMRFCNGLYGGLERVARTLNVDRVVGKCHQAGSDSLLALQTFHKIRNIYFTQDEHEKHANILFGLEVN